MIHKKSKTAVILAGGKSSRMKRDKALLEVNGKKMIDNVYEQLEPFFDEILVSVSNKNATEFSNYNIVIDEIEEQGPMVGILSGLKSASNDIVFFIAIDIPHIDFRLVEKLISFSNKYSIVVPITHNGHYEPLFAVYNKKIIPQIYTLLNTGIRKIVELFTICNTKFINFGKEETLININTPEDLKRYQSK